MFRTLICAYAMLVLAGGCREAQQPAAPAEPPPASTSTSTSTSAPAPAPAAAPAAAEAHDVTGSYVAMAELPAEFAELDHLLLATIDENAAPAPLNGFLRPKKQSAQDYTLVNPVLEGRNLTFKTIAVNGVHYEFRGTFELLKHFAADPPDYETAVLTGTLTKLRGGADVASTPVRFRYEAGG